MALNPLIFFFLYQNIKVIKININLMFFQNEITLKSNKK